MVGKEGRALKSSATFTLHPKALRAFRAAAKVNGTTGKPEAAAALLVACLAVTPAPGTRQRKP